MGGFGQGLVAREKGPSLGSGWIFDFFEAVRGVGCAHLGRGVVDLEELEDRGAVVGATFSLDSRSCAKWTCAIVAEAIGRLVNSVNVVCDW